MNTDFSTLMSQLFHTGQFGHINLTNFLISTLTVWILVHFLYYRHSKRREFYFTFMLIGIVIYFLVYFMIFVLEDLKGKTGIGIGIGLFGIFSIMRYRTDAMPVREMTYLFSIICLAVINALGTEISFLEMLVPNILIVAAVALCEAFLLHSTLATKLVQYDRVALVKPECHDELLADLKERTGLNIDHVEVGAIDYLRDTAIIKVYYKDIKANAELNQALKVKRSEWEKV
ncbi:MAG: DUF4956 domain-containing protein [Muribaculaceae bacterium]|nr:DUF4956 domain-containing protein [Muribaculaceae bacterium]